MSDVLKLPRLARDLFGTEIEARKADGGPFEVTFSASSEAPVERFFGEEVLSHKAGHVRMERLNGGAAPLLFNHNWDDPVGMLTGGRLKDGRLVVDARFFDTERAREVKTMLDGGLRNVSIGYEIHDMEETGKNRYRAIDWTLLEASIVTVPADPGVGIGRSAEDQAAKPVRITRMETTPAQPAITKEAIMAEVQNAPAGAIADIQVTENGAIEQRMSATEIEARRQLAIENLCRANKLDDRFKSNWIRNGSSLEQVADEMISLMAERDKNSAPAMIDAEKKDVEAYSLFKVIDAVRRKDWSKAGRERAFHQAAMEKTGLVPQTASAVFVPMDVLMRGQSGRRDMTAAGVSGSNYLIGTDNLGGSFIDLLRNESVVMQLGATRLSGLTGNVTIPRMTAGNTAYWLADETTQITESQPTIGQVSLSPKNVAALTEISNQLLRQSDPSVEQMIMTSIARDIGLAADVACLRGSGLSGQPQGIVGTSGVGTFDTDGTNTYSDILDAQVDVGAANALRPGCAYVADLASAALLAGRSRFASTDTPIWDGSLSRATMAGYPAIGTNQMLANTMLFGWWPSCVIGEWGVLQIDIDTAFDFTRGHIGVRGWYVMDFAMRYPAAFSYDATVA